MASGKMFSFVNLCMLTSITWDIHAEMFKDVWAKATNLQLHLHLRRRYRASKLTWPSYSTLRYIEANWREVTLQNSTYSKQLPADFNFLCVRRRQIDGYFATSKFCHVDILFFEILPLRYFAFYRYFVFWCFATATFCVRCVATSIFYVRCIATSIFCVR